MNEKSIPILYCFFFNQLKVWSLSVRLLWRKKASTLTQYVEFLSLHRIERNKIWLKNAKNRSSSLCTTEEITNIHTPSKLYGC